MYPGDSFGFIAWKLDTQAVPGAPAIKIIVRATIEDLVQHLRQSERGSPLPFQESFYSTVLNEGESDASLHNDKPVFEDEELASDASPGPNSASQIAQAAPAQSRSHTPISDVALSVPGAVGAKGISQRRALVNIEKACRFEYTAQEIQLAKSNWKAFVDTVYPYWAYDKRRAVSVVLKTQFQGTNVPLSSLLTN